MKGVPLCCYSFVLLSSYDQTSYVALSKECASRLVVTSCNRPCHRRMYPPTLPACFSTAPPPTPPCLIRPPQATSSSDVYPDAIDPTRPRKTHQHVQHQQQHKKRARALGGQAKGKTLNQGKIRHAILVIPKSPPSFMRTRGDVPAS